MTSLSMENPKLPTTFTEKHGDLKFIRDISVCSKYRKGDVFVLSNEKEDSFFVLKKVALKSSENIKNFCAEIQTTKKYSDVSTVRIFDSFEDDKDPWLLMDFIPGLDLSRLSHMYQDIEKRDVRWYKLLYGICRYFAKVSGKIVFRDLKPQNIVVDMNYEPHIIDFGESREMIGMCDINDKSEEDKKRNKQTEESKENKKNRKKKYVPIIKSFKTTPKGTERTRPPFLGEGIGQLRTYTRFYDVYSFGETISNVIKKNESATFDELVGGELGEALERCGEETPQKRPEFSELCEIIEKAACNDKNLSQQERDEFCAYKMHVDDPENKEPKILGTAANIIRSKEVGLYLFL